MDKVFGVILAAVVIAIPVGIIALTIYGLVLGFSASILVGLLHLVITPLSFVTGFGEFFFNVDLSQAIADLIHNN